MSMTPNTRLATTIPIRFRSEDRAIFEQAAELEGMGLSTFIRESALIIAKRLIQHPCPHRKTPRHAHIGEGPPCGKPSLVKASLDGVPEPQYRCERHARALYRIYRDNGRFVLIGTRRPWRSG